MFSGVKLSMGSFVLFKQFIEAECCDENDIIP